jgi:hypothetical protein
MIFFVNDNLLKSSYLIPEETSDPAFIRILQPGDVAVIDTPTNDEFSTGEKEKVCWRLGRVLAVLSL